MTRSWMPGAVAATALAAALVCLAPAPRSAADEYDVVHGAAEAPAVRDLVGCLGDCDGIRALFPNLDDRSKLTPEKAETVLGAVQALRARVIDVGTLIDDGPPFQPTTEAAFAYDSLGATVKALDKVAKKLAKPVKAKTVRKGLDKVESALLVSKLSMQGVFVESKDPVAALQFGTTRRSYVEDFDRGSIGAVLKSLQPDGPALVGTDEPARAAKKGPRRQAAAAARTVRVSGARWKTARRKGGPPRHPDAPKSPPDRYLALSAASKKQTEAGAFALGLDREIRGPFVAEATVGLLNAKKRDPAGAAYAFLEVEVPGTLPREHVRVGARATEEGVHVFALATDGDELRTRDFPDATAADVQIDYDGTNFRLYVKPEGAEDTKYVVLDSYFRPRNGDPWTVLVGAAGLTGKAEVGVDRVHVLPR